MTTGSFIKLLGHWIYQDQTLTDLVKPAVTGGLGIFASGAHRGDPKGCGPGQRTETRTGSQRARACDSTGVQPKNHADGMGFLLEPNLAAKMTGRNRWLRIPRSVESSHFLIMGDSGTGKSALIRQTLLRIEERGETAIVYDPALEYTPQFFNPSRGDLVLNPLDARMPYWTPGDELRHEAEALTLASSLFPTGITKTPSSLRAHAKSSRIS